MAVKIVLFAILVGMAVATYTKQHHQSHSYHHDGYGNRHGKHGYQQHYGSEYHTNNHEHHGYDANYGHGHHVDHYRHFTGHHGYHGQQEHGHHGYHGHHEHGYHTGHHGYHNDHHDNINYKFKYEVKDPKTYNYQSREEYKDGKNVYGSYSLVEPDGKVRIVKYKADDYGFHADVDYKGGYNHDYKPSYRTHVNLYMR